MVRTGNKILKPADDMAAPFVGMAVGAEVKNPQSTRAITNVLKSQSGGKMSNLTSRRCKGLHVKFMYFRFEKLCYKMSSSVKDFFEYDRVEKCSKCGNLFQRK